MHTCLCSTFRACLALLLPSAHNCVTYRVAPRRASLLSMHTVCAVMSVPFCLEWNGHFIEWRAARTPSAYSSIHDCGACCTRPLRAAPYALHPASPYAYHILCILHRIYTQSMLIPLYAYRTVSILHLIYISHRIYAAPHAYPTACISYLAL